MMRNDIVEVEAEQQLSSIAAAENTLLAIDAAFDNLMRELTTIANLLTPKRKSGIGKGCPWWNPRVEAALAAAKREYRSYIASPTDYRWNRYCHGSSLDLTLGHVTVNIHSEGATHRPTSG
jgi:hypothetical protein